MPATKRIADGGALRWAYSLATLALALLPLSAPSTGHNPGVPVVQIELDVFSGRPNPTWQLDDAQTIELLALLADLPIATQRKTEELGYRGFLVYRLGPGGTVAAPVRVYAGTVEIDSQPLADVRGAEAWLLRFARANGWAAILDSIPPR